VTFPAYAEATSNSRFMLSAFWRITLKVLAIAAVFLVVSGIVLVIRDMLRLK